MSCFKIIVGLILFVLFIKGLLKDDTKPIENNDPYFIGDEC